nr:unnamed protein product [Callosobruchus analis]
MMVFDVRFAVFVAASKYQNCPVHHREDEEERWKDDSAGFSYYTLIYATAGISDLKPVNMVTRVSRHVTNKVTLAGIASRSNQKLNHDNTTTKVDGAKVWIKWCPICLSNLKYTTSLEKLPETVILYTLFICHIYITKLANKCGRT